VVEADSATLLSRDLPERRIDLAMVPLVSPSVAEDLEATILFHDHLRLVVGTKSRWARRRKVTLAELVDEPWCVAPSAVGSLMADAFLASGLKMPRIAVTTTTAHLLFQLLAEEIAGRASDSAVRGRNRDAEKSHHQPGGAAFHRMRTRGCAPFGQIAITCRWRLRQAGKTHLPAKTSKGLSATKFWPINSRWRRRTQSPSPISPSVQSSLVPANFSTLAHLSVSISTKLANGAGP
jgi:LysR substrate binding domain